MQPSLAALAQVRDGASAVDAVRTHLLRVGGRIDELTAADDDDDRRDALFDHVAATVFADMDGLRLRKMFKALRKQQQLVQQQKQQMPLIQEPPQPGQQPQQPQPLPMSMPPLLKHRYQ